MNKVEREIKKIEDACDRICEKVTCGDCVLYARLGELRAELYLADRKKEEERKAKLKNQQNTNNSF